MDKIKQLFPDENSGKKGIKIKKGAVALAAAVLLLLLGFGGSFFVWFFCRIETQADQIVVLIQKTGADLPSGQIVATSPDQKGIQLEVLPEGRYFYNPYTWSWIMAKVTDIPAGKLGIVTRLYGDELPPSEIIATEGKKGIEAEVLRPGKYRLNPYAVHVQMFNATTIRPGHVGVVTSLTGRDVLTTDIPEGESNSFLVPDGLKGVVQKVLDPGTYYLHPYMYNVVEVNLQSQRFEMSGADVISFLTLDGFTVTVEGTIEYALQRDKAALLTHRVGDMADIIKKVILPRARGFSRIEGSKHPSIDFIVGETRQKFQNDLESHLREKSIEWGVDINSVLIRKIVVPDQIASISRNREMAVQEVKKYEQQIEQAKSQAELVKQEMLAQQSKEKVGADTERIRSVINAEQEQEVRLIAARRELEVAKLKKDASQFQAESILLKANGEKDAIAKRNEAEASVVQNQVKALGGGQNLARYTFYEKIGPRVNSILSNDTEDGLGGIFKSYIPKYKEQGNDK
jgi:regulator of protease activity HflC (stomatin/prohibitin superfamily)